MALALAIAAFTIYAPTPYVLNAPGRAVPVSSIVSIEDPKSKPVDGQFLMTTVLSEKATVLLCIYALLDPAATLSRDHVEGETHRAQSPGGSDQMELAQYISTRVALEKLGYQIQGKFLGLQILGIAPDSPNRESLQPGDLLIELDGKAKIDVADFRATIEDTTSGKALAAKVLRGGNPLSVKLSTMEVQGKQRAGVILRPQYSSVQLPIKVDFQSGNTSGASGGLVFALEIYDRLDVKTNLAKGRVIAATGTLDPSGQVGPIEGIAYKLVGAERAGASIFLVPRDNWPEIENVPTNMTVIPVSTFEEALRALE